MSSHHPKTPFVQGSLLTSLQQSMHWRETKKNHMINFQTLTLFGIKNYKFFAPRNQKLMFV